MPTSPPLPYDESGSSVVLAASIRRLEQRLLERLAMDQERSRSHPVLLARPHLVLVPSGSLREHLCRRLASSGTQLGVSVRTLLGFAKELLALGPAPEPAAAEAGALLPVLVARAVAQRTVLESALGRFERGIDHATAIVRDLLDAGFETEDFDAVRSLLAEDEPNAERERALSFVGIARDVRSTIQELRILGPGDLLARAAMRLPVLAANASTALPRAVTLYGFADATGRATAFLRALQRNLPTVTLLERSHDPARPERRDRGERFLERLRSRLCAGVPVEEDGTPPTPPELDCFHASGRGAEVREVLERVRARLAAGLEAEDLLIVVRDAARWLPEFVRTARALGVPLARTTLPNDGAPSLRGTRCLLRLLHDGERSSLDDWFEWSREHEVARDDLAHWLRSEGATQLRHLAEWNPGRDRRSGGPPRLALRTRTRLPEGATVERWSYRSVPASVLDRARDQARRALALLTTWPERATAERHAEHLDRLLGLGSAPDGSARSPEELLRALRQELPPTLALDRREFLEVLARHVDAQNGEATAGGGAGVRLLDLSRARGMVCEHLFLVGVGRNSFPRPVQEDPLFRDRLRAKLASVLPDVPLKLRGHDEERHLFSHFLFSAPRITISWQRSDEAGREQLPSVLVQRLLDLRPDSPAPVAVPRLEEERLDAPFSGGAERPRPLRDSLRLTALTGEREEFLAVAGEAMPEGIRDALGATLREFDPTFEHRRRLGSSPSPWFGRLAAVTEPADPRSESVFVSHLEQSARCPWKGFLEKLLLLAPPPEPERDFPELDARRVGIAVHEALELLRSRVLPEDARSAADERPSTLDALEDLAPVAVPAPTAADVDAAVTAASEHALAGLGQLHPALLVALAGRVRPAVEVAVRLDFDRPFRDWYASEWNGCCEVEVPLGDGRVRSELVRFRADCVELDPAEAEPTFLVTDFKTGKPLREAVKQETRERDLQRAIERGTHLQIAAYAASARLRPVRARYLHLLPETKDEQREFSVHGRPGRPFEGREFFERTTALLLRARHEGIAPPRLEDGKEKRNPTCDLCDLKVACIHGDSTARHRLRQFVRSLPAEDTLARLWSLGEEGTEGED